MISMVDVADGDEKCCNCGYELDGACVGDKWKNRWRQRLRWFVGPEPQGGGECLDWGMVTMGGGDDDDDEVWKAWRE